MARAHGSVRRNRTAADSFRVDIMALRDQGLSYRAIAIALRHFRDADLTPHQIEYALARWGEQPDARKQRLAA